MSKGNQFTHRIISDFLGGPRSARGASLRFARIYRFFLTSCRLKFGASRGLTRELLIGSLHALGRHLLR